MSTWRHGCLLVLLFATPAMAQPEVVRLVTLQWEPYVGSELQNQGYTAEIVSAAFALSGREVELQFTSWSRALQKTELGEFHGVFPTYRSEERERRFALSDSLGESTLVFAARKGDSHFYRTLRDLAGYRIGVVKGYLNTRELDTADYLQRIVAYDDAANLKRLLIGRLDLAVIDRQTAAYILKLDYAEQKHLVQFLEPPLKRKSLHLAFSRARKDAESARKDFNRGLKQLRRSGELQKILVRHGID